MTLRQAIDAAAVRLADAGVGSPRVDAEFLAAHAAGVDRGRLAVVDLSASAPDFDTRFAELVSARARRVPLQHLLGSAAFGPVTVAVGPGVFVPRPEAEALLEWACARELADEPVIVDLCTGSGALALALARHWPRAHVVAVDDDEVALGYARRNLAATGARVVRADVTDRPVSPELDGLAGRVDLLVANPPYIPAGATLEPEVADHDPSHALFAGDDGMSVIPAIVDDAARWLRRGGVCAIEHDDTTSASTVAAFERAGVFGDITARRDLAGRLRFVTATKVRQDAVTATADDRGAERE